MRRGYDVVRKRSSHLASRYIDDTRMNTAADPKTMRLRVFSEGIMKGFPY